MERAVYCIALRKGEWTIELNDTPVAPCPSKEIGIHAAVSAAQRAYLRGHRAHVLEQDGSHFHSIWFNGKQQRPLPSLQALG